MGGKGQEARGGGEGTTLGSGSDPREGQRARRRTA